MDKSLLACFLGLTVYCKGVIKKEKAVK